MGNSKMKHRDFDDALCMQMAICIACGRLYTFLVALGNTAAEISLAPVKSTRETILDEAKRLTTGDRNKTYGDPYDNMKTFATLIDTYLRALGWTGPPLDSVDGSMVMSFSKSARIAVNKGHQDNYVDGTAYVAIAGECAVRELEKDNDNG
jgi:hypothetical protein